MTTIPNKPVHKSAAGKSWRLVYDGTDLIGLFEGTGVTVTIWELEEFASKAAAEARIEQLGLKKIEPQKKDAL